MGYWSDQDHACATRGESEQNAHAAHEVVDEIKRIRPAIPVFALQIANRHAIVHPSEIIAASRSDGGGVGVAQQAHDRARSIRYGSTRMQDDDPETLIDDGVGPGQPVRERGDASAGLDMQRSVCSDAMPPSADVIAGSCGRCSKLIDRDRRDPRFQI